MKRPLAFVKRHVFELLFFFLFFFLIFLTYQDYGIAWDEKIFFNVGAYYAKELLNFLRIPHNLNLGEFVPTPYHIRGHGVFFDVIFAFVTVFFERFSYEIVHLTRALFALPIFLLIYVIVSKLLSRVYGFIAMVFLLIFPRFYGNMFLNAIDLPTALFFTLSLAYFIYYVKTKQTIIKSIIFGVVLGLTISQRQLFIYIAGLNFLFLLWYAHVRRLPMRNIFFLQCISVVFILITLHLTHPYLLQHPVTGLVDIFRSAQAYPWNAGVLFEGKFYSNLYFPLPWYYLPKSMFITIPEGILFLFLLGNIAMFLKLVKGSNWEKFIFAYLLCLYYIPFALIILLKPTLYDSWRQFLFLTIPTIIFAVYGLSWLFNKKKVLLAIFVFVTLVFTTLEMIRLHPYEYFYYNAFIGGLKGASENYETDYWGLSFKEAAQWLNNNLDDPTRHYTLFVEGDPLSSFYYLKPNVTRTTDPNEADYVFTFTR
ncbi:glycosyltransferase family 39 protein, partial [Candidatus Roizmanbacteria bacterium]|nr:glycosyltransferase family 39 protein [Candidatus Roizmanbacteria bacterium]